MVQILTLSVRALRRLLPTISSMYTQITGLTMVVKRSMTARLSNGMQTGSVVRPRLMLVILPQLIKFAATVFTVTVVVVNFCSYRVDGYYGTETETTYYDAWYEVRLQLEWF